MNDVSERDIRSRTRNAYERARAVNALALAAIVVTPATLFSVRCCPTDAASILCGLTLGSAIALAHFAGKEAKAALRPGLIAGGIAFALPGICHGLMACSEGMCVSPRLRFIPLAAVGAGFLGGVAMRALAGSGSRFVAATTAFLLGALGSLAIGLSGPVWTALGLAAGAFVPVRRPEQVSR